MSIEEGPAPTTRTSVDGVGETSGKIGQKTSQQSQQTVFRKVFGFTNVEVVCDGHGRRLRAGKLGNSWDILQASVAHDGARPDLEFRLARGLHVVVDLP